MGLLCFACLAQMCLIVPPALSFAENHLGLRRRASALSCARVIAAPAEGEWAETGNSLHISIYLKVEAFHKAATTEAQRATTLIQVDAKGRGDAEDVVVDEVLRGLVVRVAVPEAPRAAAHALLTPLTQHHLHDELVAVIL